MKVLILSATASAINYIRALGPRPDVELFVSDANPLAAGLFAERVEPRVLPRADDLDSYSKALDQVLERDEIDVVIPTSDQDVESFVTLLDRGWQPRAAHFRPSYESWRVLTDKRQLAARLAGGGPVAVPREYASSEEVVFPVVVKPVDDGGSKGVSIVTNPLELTRALSEASARGRGTPLLQEFVPGGVGHTYVALLLYDTNGALISGGALQSTLTFLTWGGGGNAGRIVDEPALVEAAARVVETFGGWRGPINLEFRRHADTGRFYLIEANCRLNGYSYLTTMNGHDFPSAILDLLTKGSTDRLPRILPPGGRNFVLGLRERPVESWLAEE